MSDLIWLHDAVNVADMSDYTGLSVEDVKKVTDEVVKGLKALPTVDAVPVVHGHWGEPQGDGCITYDKNAYRQCSVCGNRQFLGMQMNYCPHCGAKMDEVTES